MRLKLFILFILIFIGLCFVRIVFKSNITSENKPITSYQFQTERINNDEAYKYIPLVLETFFDNKIQTQQLKLPKEHIITLIATGDVLTARKVNTQINYYKDPHWQFIKIYETLNDADITLINLENPLIENCPLTEVGMIFCGLPLSADGLLFSGIDVANIANNHAGNYGTDGILQTMDTLDEKGILVTGDNDNNVRFITVKGSIFGFLGYNDVSKPQPGIANAEEMRIVEEITNTKNNADIVIVSFHWGDEYKSKPNKRQRDLAKLAIDAGADLIIGNHPHWVQSIEIYNDKLIIYSHGNFVFDQMWSEKTKEGIIGKYYFFKNKLIDAEFMPIYIENYGQPIILTNEKGEKVISDLYNNSLVVKESSN